MAKTSGLIAFFTTSLQRQLILVLAVLVVLIMLIAGGYWLNTQWRSASAELEARAEQTVSLLGKTLSAPLWNLDLRSIYDQIEAAMADQHIFSVALYASGSTQPMAARQREGQPVDAIECEARVFYTRDQLNPVEVGYVRVVYTRQYLYQELASTQVLLLTMVLFLAAALAAVTSISLERIVLRPVGQIVTLTDRIADGDYATRIQVASHNEIGHLAHSCNRMAEQLQSSHASLIALARDLENKVTERTREVEQRAGQITQLYQDISREKQHLESLVQNSPVAIVVTDLDLKVISWNPGAEKLFGYTQAEALGSNLDDLIVGDDRMLAEARTLSQQLSQDGLVQTITQRGRKDGCLVDVELLAVPLNDATGQVRHLVLYHDITELQRARQEALEARHIAESNARVAEEARAAAETASRAKSEFLAHMSHELRTPLNGILGYTQILKRDKALTTRQQNGLDIIHRSGEHLLMLINDILDLAKIEAGKMDLYPADFQLETFLQSIVGITHMRADQKNLRLEYQALTNLPHAVHADEKRLRQVLLNLLGNAIKFTEQGHVVFRVSQRGLQAGQGDQPALVCLRFEVQDSGIGLSSEQVARLFRPFEQVGDVYQRTEGSGLGLAISQQLVQAMGDSIRVESQPGQGSTFWFEVSLPVTTVESRPEQVSGVVGYAGPRKTVLVVDDKPYNRAVLLDLLSPLGFEMAEAANGDQAIQCAREIRPDIIFMDLVMPASSGFEAVQIIRQLPELKDTVIIAQSASAFNEDQERSLVIGCDAFLAKPIEVSKLFALMEKHLKLQWLYSQPSAPVAPAEPEGQHSVSLLAPPLEKLRALYDLIEQGNMRRIREWATDLEQTDARYHPFAGQVQAMARGFQKKQLAAMIEQYMEQCLEA